MAETLSYQMIPLISSSRLRWRVTKKIRYSYFLSKKRFVFILVGWTLKNSTELWNSELELWNFDPRSPFLVLFFWNLIFLHNRLHRTYIFKQKLLENGKGNIWKIRMSAFQKYHFHFLTIFIREDMRAFWWRLILDFRWTSKNCHELLNFETSLDIFFLQK